MSVYTVIDPNGESIFEVIFNDDTLLGIGPSFTFDDPDGNDWLSHKVDFKNHIIYAEIMNDWMNHLIEKYEDEYNDSNVNYYGYVEIG